MQHGKLLFVVLIMLGSAACRPTFDADEARTEILEMHRGFIEAHLEKDVGAITRSIPDDYLFVGNGDVETLSADDTRQMLQSYFDRTVFSHYTDTDEPIIGFSEDGTLAWAIFQVRVAGTSHRESEPDAQFDTQWAWMTLYEKRDGEWMVKADVSTNRPFTAE
jgi:ketosteroid isomerase-like protein